MLFRAMDQTEMERVVLLGSSAFTITSNYRLGFTKYDENNREILDAARAHPDHRIAKLGRHSIRSISRS